jgi:pseudomonalisin
MKSRLLKSAVGLALLGLVASGVGAQASPSDGAYFAMKNAPRLSSKDTVTGALELTHPIQVVVTLKLRNEAQLDAFLATPGHGVLTSEQFMAQYSPTRAQAQAVANFLMNQGFRNVTIAPNRLQVTADGSTREAQNAFQTRMLHVRTHDGRDAFANADNVKIPTEISGQVQAVLGLQTVHIGHTFAQVLKTDGLHTDAVTGHDPTNFASIYTDSSLATASGVPVGIVVEGSMTNVLKDLASFTSANGLPTVTTQTVNTDGTSTDTSGDVEWDLDSQDIEGITGGVQKIIFYDIPSLSDANMTADFNAIVTANAVKVINVSIGECETDAKSDGSAASDDTIFKTADAQGQTFSISSGDSGADECGTGGTTPSWPASSQYVVAVGGTSLNASTTTWTSEVVWNNLAENNGATGGSPSTFEPMPSWQSGVGQNAGHTTRGVPDVAFDADPNSGAEITVDGASEQVGGTSLASPLFVGTWARMLQAKGSTLGFAAPLIYADAAGHAATDFHDVTSGNNSGETAAAGWDYTTGFGSIIASSFVNNVGGGSSPTPPTASNGSVTTPENTAVNGTLSATGTAPLSFVVVANPTHGTVSITNAATGAFTYTPTSGYTGSDSFTFDASNSAGTSNTATESVTVTSTAVSPPTASNGSVTTSQNTAVNGTLSASGTGTLTFAVVANPTHGTVSITNAATGAFTYTPTSGYTGADSFTFDAKNSGGTSNVATESVTVNAVSTGCPTGYTAFTGSITQGNDVFEPNNTYYQTTKTGVNAGILSGPSGTDFDLYLYKWSSSRGWTVVASSTGNTSSETINYNGTAGYYEWDIYAFSGSGSFQFCLKHP